MYAPGRNSTPRIKAELGRGRHVRETYAAGIGKNQVVVSSPSRHDVCWRASAPEFTTGLTSGATVVPAPGPRPPRTRTPPPAAPLATPQRQRPTRGRRAPALATQRPTGRAGWP